MTNKYQKARDKKFRKWSMIIIGYRKRKEYQQIKRSFKISTVLRSVLPNFSHYSLSSMLLSVAKQRYEEV